ncbi:hypothetical protein [Streptosporangium sp. NPDC087985]|uniref:hypothetical protein n=1 Tax=Streptosporangium sp. NPDC087985 TaxID=3366196 RepID=UPI00382AA8DE
MNPAPGAAHSSPTTVRQSLDTQLDSLKAAGVTRIFSEKISTRATSRPELDKAVALARELRAAGVAVRTRGKAIGGTAVTDATMLSMALHLREQNLSLRDIVARLVITKGKKKGQHPSPATVLRLLREQATVSIGFHQAQQALEVQTRTNADRTR